MGLAALCCSTVPRGRLMTDGLAFALRMRESVKMMTLGGDDGDGDQRWPNKHRFPTLTILI